jgi:hypothetical protein
MFGRGLCDDLITLPKVRRFLCSRNLVNEEAVAHWGLLRPKEKERILIRSLMNV